MIGWSSWLWSCNSCYLSFRTPRYFLIWSIWSSHPHRIWVFPHFCVYQYLENAWWFQNFPPNARSTRGSHRKNHCRVVFQKHIEKYSCNLFHSCLLAPSPRYCWSLIITIVQILKRLKHSLIHKVTRSILILGLIGCWCLSFVEIGLQRLLQTKLWS